MDVFGLSLRQCFAAFFAVSQIEAISLPMEITAWIVRLPPEYSTTVEATIVDY